MAGFQRRQTRGDVLRADAPHRDRFRAPRRSKYWTNISHGGARRKARPGQVVSVPVTWLEMTAQRTYRPVRSSNVLLRWNSMAENQHIAAVMMLFSSGTRAHFFAAGMLIDYTTVIILSCGNDCCLRRAIQFWQVVPTFVAAGGVARPSRSQCLAPVQALARRLLAAMRRRATRLCWSAAVDNLSMRWHRT